MGRQYLFAPQKLHSRPAYDATTYKQHPKARFSMEDQIPRNHEPRWKLETPPPITIQVNNAPDGTSEIQLQQRTTLKALGTQLTPDGDTWTSVQHRLNLASRAYFAKLKDWTSTAPNFEKLKAWVQNIQPMVLHGCRNWILSQKVVHHIRKWELEKLRRTFGYRRRPIENPEHELIESTMAYNQRTALLIYSTFRRTNCTMLRQKIIQALYKEAWRERTQTSHRGNLLSIIRSARSRIWWEAVRSDPPQKRQKGYTKHEKQGPNQMWEDPLVATIGLNWRGTRDQLLEPAEWKSLSRNHARDLMSPPKMSTARENSQK